jgi:hypothetical protein
MKITAYKDMLEEPQHTKQLNPPKTKLCIGNTARKREGEAVHGENEK